MNTLNEHSNPVSDSMVAVPAVNPSLITPLGGRLVDLCVEAEMAEELKAEAAALPSVQISERCIFDLEILATGGFSPLDRFMEKPIMSELSRRCAWLTGRSFPFP